MIILNELSTELLNRAAAKREARSRAYLAFGNPITKVSDNLNRAKKIRAYATKKHAQRLSLNGKPLSFETPRSNWQPHQMPPDGKLLPVAPKSTSKPPRQEAPKSTSTPPRQEALKSNGLQIAAPKSNGSWFGRNKGKVALGIGVGTAAAYGIHKYRQNKKKKEEEARRQAEAEAQNKKSSGFKRILNKVR